MRRRIVVFAAGVALLASALLAVPLGIVAARGYVRDERLELQQAAATAAAQARGDVTTAVQVPNVDRREIRLTVYDRSAGLISGPGSSISDRLARAALAGRQASHVDGASVSVSAPVSDGDTVVAALVLRTDLGAAHARSRHAWLLLAAMCALAVLVCGSGAWLLAGRLTRPVRTLASVASRVGAGDLSARAVASGIGELDALAATFNRTVGRVQTMIDRERAFSSEVSHQLRTPLSGLRLDLEAALADVPAGAGHAALREHVRSAMGAVDRLEATTVDIIRLARDVPSGQVVELTAVLEAVELRWRGRLAGASRPLRLVAAGVGAGRMRLSEAATTQILDVLIDNAWRHGRGAITVRVIAADRHGSDGSQAVAATVTVEVSDEGPSLTMEAWQLFERRTPVDQPGHTSSGGHGIGLRYARTLAEAEGARLVLQRSSPPTFALVAASAPQSA